VHYIYRGGRPPEPPVATQAILTPLLRCVVPVRACGASLRSPASAGMPAPGAGAPSACLPVPGG